jgi:hypothetical protein
VGSVIGSILALILVFRLCCRRRNVPVENEINWLEGDYQAPAVAEAAAATKNVKRRAPMNKAEISGPVGPVRDQRPISEGVNGGRNIYDINDPYNGDLENEPEPPQSPAAAFARQALRTHDAFYSVDGSGGNGDDDDYDYDDPRSERLRSPPSSSAYYPSTGLPTTASFSSSNRNTRSGFRQTRATQELPRDLQFLEARRARASMGDLARTPPAPEHTYI